MKIYVAGASREVETSVKYITKLKEMGFEITHDWTEEVLDYKKRGITDKELTNEEKYKFAKLDIQGIIDADIVWVILPENPVGVGYWIELGAALGLQLNYKKKIVISGDYSRSI